MMCNGFVTRVERICFAFTFAFYYKEIGEEGRKRRGRKGERERGREGERERCGWREGRREEGVYVRDLSWNV